MKHLVVRKTETQGIGQVTCPRGLIGEVCLVKQCRQCPWFREEGLWFRKRDCVQYIGCVFKKE